ncbi:peptidoglycan D,D-transpeptidase FtsI family protein [Fructilactobacillus cliffordii]|uniref:Penicillin-binding protein 2 n=1 Tax=Fructilactobacillus cliffordii TaxID=2940299 RepID=A0A9Q9E118_9LACO|nr:penicillin-binding protein 2 [Fructilactobacillus cliffordii]USS89721.1 penicillin-binding protein 2 [Fructilactobacillus cliffordii]
MGNFFGRFFKKKTRTKRQETGNKRIPFRLNLIFLLVGALFAVLIWKLADLQLIQGNYFKSAVNKNNSSTVYGNVQRGMIYDSTGKLLVGNKTERAITYTRGPKVTVNDMYQVATKLSKIVKVPTNKLTKKQMAQYYLASTEHQTQMAKQVPNAQNLNPDQKVEAELKIAQKNPPYQETTQFKNAAAIYISMSGAYRLTTTYVKYDNVSNQEIAQVGEHAQELPGVQVGTNWTREYPNGKEIQSITGTVTSNQVGLPDSRMNQLLSQGYSQNEAAGNNSLEEQYEPVLRGSKSQTDVKLNSDDQIVKAVKKYPGRRGDNLQLSINGKFQKELQDMVKKAQPGGNATGTYAVVMNPNTGAIIGMAGVSRNPKTGKVTQNDLGVMNSSITMGSVVKGATVYGALRSKVITPESSTLTDMPIKNGGTTKSSWFNKTGAANIALNASDALEVSSNSYMMQLAMKEAGYHYVEGAPLNMNPNIFNIERGYFNQFGLGVKTGIDLPNETTGIEGPGGFANIGKALDESFGNYDGYTTLQVAQYMSTIANGGYRVRPHVVENVRSTNGKTGKLGAVRETIMPQVLNTVPMSTDESRVIKQGLYQVVHGHNKYKTGGALADIKPEISAKTGTAQTFYNGQETTTLSLASYAPSDHPQVVVALAMTNLPNDAQSNNIDLAKNIYQAYWKDVQHNDN